MKGPLIAWAFQWAKYDLETLRRGVEQSSQEMIHYVNVQAEFSGCFPGNPPVGRAKQKQTAAAPSLSPSKLVTSEVKDVNRHVLTLTCPGDTRPPVV